MSMLSVAQVDHSPAPTAAGLRATARRLIVLASGDATALLDLIPQIQEQRFEVVRVVRVDDLRPDVELIELSVAALLRDQIWGIVVSSSDHCKLPCEALLQCRINGIRVLSETSFWEQEARFIDTATQNPSWFLSAEGFRSSQVEQLRQRAFDLIIATALLALTLPLMLMVALLIKLDSRGPIMYRQDRTGLGGRSFSMLKFRSMRTDAETSGSPRWCQQADPRITRVGRLIRLTRIDELPQLLNVLRGNMSVIGPRPERPYFVDRLAAVIPHYNARHFVKPGITGWAQVKAPYGASIEDAQTKLRYDLYYVKHRGLRLDLLILLKTFKVILLQKGAR